jgi:hypothetical protein
MRSAIPTTSRSRNRTAPNFLEWLVPPSAELGSRPSSVPVWVDGAAGEFPACVVAGELGIVLLFYGECEAVLGCAETVAPHKKASPLKMRNWLTRFANRTRSVSPSAELPRGTAVPPREWVRCERLHPSRRSACVITLVRSSRVRHSSSDGLLEPLGNERGTSGHRFREPNEYLEFRNYHFFGWSNSAHSGML